MDSKGVWVSRQEASARVNARKEAPGRTEGQSGEVSEELFPLYRGKASMTDEGGGGRGGGRQ